MAEEVQGHAAEESESAESSEATIAVHWREEGYYPPPPKFIGQANASDPAILDRFAEENFPECFREYADLLSWDQYWHTTLDTGNAPFWKWFVGGELNASYNCVDRHLETHPNKAALIWVPEPESEVHQAITYRELYVRVNEFAAVLKDLGLKAGDRITFHMPMVPELPVAMLAAARLGIVHSQVFAGFSGTAAGHRIADSGSTVLQVAMNIAAPREITVITHALKIVEEVGTWEKPHLICLGGLYLPEYQTSVGPLTLANLRDLTADVAFLGCDGLTLEDGLITLHMLVGEVGAALAARARRVVVVADSTKLGRAGFTPFVGLDAVNVLVTDDRADSSIVAQIQQLGIEVLLA